MESDICPYQIQIQILSSPYFKGVSYLLLSYFIILGGKGYCIVAAIITFMFACVLLAFAPKIDINYNMRSTVGDEEDIITISEYQPPEITSYDDQFERDKDNQQT